MKKITAKSRLFSIIILASFLVITHPVCEAASVTKLPLLTTTKPTTNFIKASTSKPGTKPSLKTSNNLVTTSLPHVKEELSKIRNPRVWGRALYMGVV